MITVGMFGFDFYKALAGCDRDDDPQAVYAQDLYRVYLKGAGIAPDVADRKAFVFRRYSNAECSPEVMCNFGDNDPEWSRAFNKLSMLIEYHPACILFDSGSLNPLESSGKIHGDGGHNNAGPMEINDAVYTGAQQVKRKSDMAGGATRPIYDK